MKIRTTSLECVIEDLVDGTEYIVTVVPSYDLEWEDVQEGSFPLKFVLRSYVYKTDNRKNLFMENVSYSIDRGRVSKPDHSHLPSGSNFRR